MIKNLSEFVVPRQQDKNLKEGWDGKLINTNDSKMIRNSSTVVVPRQQGTNF